MNGLMLFIERIEDMRGQWIDYDSFNLIDLIDELKTRVKEPHNTDDILHGMIIINSDYSGLCESIRDYLEKDDEIYRQEKEFVKELEKKEKRQTVFIEYGGRTPLYNALPSCEHEIVGGDNCSGIKCRKCGGWYCA